MKILVVGGGGREHAIVMKLAESPQVEALYCAPGNGGIAKYAKCFPVKATDIDGVVAFSKENKPDLVVVTPDDPLALGMVDALEAVGIRAFGPHKNAAVIEGSKSFAKDLMQKYNIPTAGYAVFENSADAIAYIKENGAPIVIKADGLAAGKSYIEALRTRQFEPDGPNYTPRISGVVEPNGAYELSILKSFDGDPTCNKRFFFEYDAPRAGLGHFIHTYKTDGNPLPSFEGEPETVRIEGDLNTFADMVWDNLNEENKVSLYVSFIDLETGKASSIIRNKHC